MSADLLVRCFREFIGLLQKKLPRIQSEGLTAVVLLVLFVVPSIVYLASQSETLGVVLGVIALCLIIGAALVVLWRLADARDRSVELNNKIVNETSKHEAQLAEMREDFVRQLNDVAQEAAEFWIKLTLAVHEDEWPEEQKDHEDWLEQSVNNSLQLFTEYTRKRGPEHVAAWYSQMLQVVEDRIARREMLRRHVPVL